MKNYLIGILVICLATGSAAFTNAPEAKVNKMTSYYWFPTNSMTGALTQTSAVSPGQQDPAHNRLGCDQVPNFFCGNGYLASNPGISISGTTVTVSASATPDAIVKKTNP